MEIFHKSKGTVEKGNCSHGNSRLSRSRITPCDMLSQNVTKSEYVKKFYFMVFSPRVPCDTYYIKLKKGQGILYSTISKGNKAYSSTLHSLM